MNEQQAKRLYRIINILKKRNPYYGKVLGNYSTDLMKTADIYALLPYMNRNKLQELGTQIYTPTIEKITLEMTSGTTGIPLECPKTNSERINLAIDLWKKRQSIDCLVNKNNFFLLYGSKARKEQNFFDYEPSNLRKCMEYLENINPRWICGSISAFYQYAKEIMAGTISNRMTNLRYLELQGEFVENDIRRYVEDVFNVKTIVHYGNREIWTMAYECPYGNLHPNDGMVYFEIIKERNSDQYGRIIVTSFNQIILPIIKYDTGDLGRFDECNCPCGQHTTLNIFDGRISTIIKGTSLNGNIVVKGILNDVIKKNQQIINRFYVEQHDQYVFVVYIVKGPEYSDDIEFRISKGFKEKIDKNVKVLFRYVPRGNNIIEGKSPIFRVCY